MTLDELREDLKDLRAENHAEHRDMFELMGKVCNRTTVLETKWKHLKILVGLALTTLAGIIVRMIV